MNLLDRAIATLSPNWALRREVARMRLSLLSTYAAAEKSRLTGDWPSKESSADQAALPDMRTMNARARAARRDDWCGASIVGAHRRNIVGKGIWPRPNGRDSKGQLMTEYNRAAYKAFRRWARNPKLCDVEGRKPLTEVLGLLVDEWVTTGNGLAIMSVARIDGRRVLQLQVVEVEQLAVEKDTGGRPLKGNEIRGGVEVNRVGRPLAYWIHRTDHPMESTEREPERVPADRVLHLSRQTRPRETLPPSKLAPVMRKMFDRDTYDGAELVAKKMEAFLGFAIKKPAGGSTQIGFVPPTGATRGAEGDGRDAGGNRQIQFEPGMMPVLLDGEEIQMFNPQRPGGQYPAYMRAQVSMIAAGAGLGYPIVARDFTGGNFSSQRQGMLEDWKEIDPMQELMANIVIRPLWEMFVTVAVLNGDLEAPGFFTNEAMRTEYLEIEVYAPAKPWIDPAKEANAAQIAIKNRLKTREAITSQQGDDWRDTFEQIAEERELAEELGVPLPEDVETQVQMAAATAKKSSGNADDAKTAR